MVVNAGRRLRAVALSAHPTHGCGYLRLVTLLHCCTLKKAHAETPLNANKSGFMHSAASFLLYLIWLCRPALVTVWKIHIEWSLLLSNSAHTSHDTTAPSEVQQWINVPRENRLPPLSCLRCIQLEAYNSTLQIVRLCCSASVPTLSPTQTWWTIYEWCHSARFSGELGFFVRRTWRHHYSNWMTQS